MSHTSINLHDVVGFNVHPLSPGEGAEERFGHVWQNIDIHLKDGSTASLTLFFAKGTPCLKVQEGSQPDEPEPLPWPDSTLLTGGRRKP